MDTQAGEIDRANALLRALFTLVFFVIVRVVELVLAALIVFELLVTLITGQLPAEGVRRFANRVTTYLYRIIRYLTFNESAPPFPFEELPVEIEAPSWSSGSAEMEVLGLKRE